MARARAIRCLSLIHICIRRSGIPVVCVDREPAGIACDGVYIDNFGACYEATREVLARGWRNIAYMADPPVYAPGRQRLRAFETACAEFGVQVPPENRMLAPIEAWRERGADVYKRQLKAFVRELTDLPVELVLTHGHVDLSLIHI